MSVQEARPGKKRDSRQNLMSSDQKALIREVRERVRSRGYDIAEIARDLRRHGPRPNADANG